MSDTLTVSDVLTKVDVPEGTVGSASIQRFEITQGQVTRALFHPGRRGRTDPGIYTKLVVSGELWMSDTEDERSDHWKAVRAMMNIPHDQGRVLITGLGIGMAVQAALRVPQVAHVDVVESNPDVIALAAPHYERMATEAGKTLAVHQGDAHDRKGLFPNGETWDVAWHDIWLEISPDNLASMATLARRYTRHVKWQGFWAKEECRYHRDRERRDLWWR